MEEARRTAGEEIFKPARWILKEAGIDEERVIIREAEDVGYAAVVMGKRGRSMLREFMFGSVSSKVVHHIQGCAIWIVE